MSAKRKLSDTFVEKVQPPAKGRELHYDSQLPGLALQVTSYGGKSFVFYRRFPGSAAPTRAALRHDDGRPVASVSEARAVGRAWLDQIEAGIDPRREAERLRQEEKRRNAGTFGELAERYITQRVSKQRRGKVTAREIRRELVSRWGDRPVTEITRADVITMIDDIAGRGATRQAHNMFANLRSFMNWVVERGLMEASPCDRVSPQRLIGEKKHRQRVLTDDELRALWRASERLGYPYGPWCQLLILTGARKSEVAEARWREFDLERRLWTIPPERFKSDAVHVVPLSDEAMAVLEMLPLWQQGDFVFSTTHGRLAINSAARAKARLDELLLDELGGPAPNWIFHDLRRTVRTRLSALRIPFEVAELVVGHSKRGLARVYDQHEYADEMRDALARWAALLRLIVDPPLTGKVVALRAEAAGYEQR